MRATIHSWFAAGIGVLRSGGRARRRMSSACSGVAMRVRTMSVALTACLVAAAGLGAPASVGPFDSAAWDRLQQELPRPAAVGFTATYCATCPAGLGKL